MNWITTISFDQYNFRCWTQGKNMDPKIFHKCHLVSYTRAGPKYKNRKT